MDTVDTVGSGPRSRLRAAAEVAMLVVGVMAVGLMPRRIGPDGEVRLSMMHALLDHGRLLNTKYSLVGPLFSTPLYLPGRLYQSPDWWLERYNYCVFVLGMLAFYLLLRNRMDRGALRAFLLLLVVASMFPYHLMDYYGDVFTAVLVGVGLTAAVLGPRLAGWGVVVLGIVNTPGTLVSLGCVAAARMLHNRRLRYLLAPAAALGLVCAEAWLRRGSPLALGYADDVGVRTVLPYSGRLGFSYPFYLGMLSIFLSFGKGLVFYVPGLFLPIRSRLLSSPEPHKRELYHLYVLWVAFVVGLVLLYSRWYGWDGGWYWGPRFFLFASIPASFALALRLRRPDSTLIGNVLTLLAFALALWVGIDGAVFGLRTLSDCPLYRATMEPVCLYAPEFSPLWRPFVVPSPLNWQALGFVAYSLVVGAYLALPLLARTATQLRGLLPTLVGPYLAVRSWRW